jgi:hypothetical protein
VTLGGTKVGDVLGWVDGLPGTGPAASPITYWRLPLSISPGSERTVGLVVGAHGPGVGKLLSMLSRHASDATSVDIPLTVVLHEKSGSSTVTGARLVPPPRGWTVAPRIHRGTVTALYVLLPQGRQTPAAIVHLSLWPSSGTPRLIRMWQPVTMTGALFVLRGLAAGRYNWSVSLGGRVLASGVGAIHCSSRCAVDWSTFERDIEPYALPALRDASGAIPPPPPPPPPRPPS